MTADQIPKGAGSSAAHSALVHAIMIKVGARPYIRIWKRVVGLFYRVRKNNLGQVVEAVAIKIGEEGEPDLDGVLRRWDGIGQRFGIECKTGEAGQNTAQKRYQAMLESMGGLYILARSPEQALEILERERVRGQPGAEEAKAQTSKTEAARLPGL